MSALFFWDRSQRRQGTDDLYDLGSEIIHYKGADYRRRGDLEYYLLMGTDKTLDSIEETDTQINNQQADFLLLMVVDHTAEAYYGIHINRDTMAEIKRIGLNGASTGTYTAQICLAHAYGTGKKDSCRYQVWAVSRYFYDLPIKHYVAMTLDGIPVLNDAVGGVVVHVTDDFSRSDPSLVMGQDIRLKGKQAQTYVQGRKAVSDGSNLNRMNRQREYINGFYQEFSSCMAQSDSFAMQLVDEVSPYITSDMYTMDLALLAQSVKDYRFTTIYTIEGEAVYNENTEYMEFYADEEAFQDMLIRLFYQKIS